MYVTAAEFAAQMPDASKLMSDEPEMESSLHYSQLLILVTCLEWLWRDRQDYFIGANLTIYFSAEELRNRDFRGPDFFVVQDVQNYPRPSWVVWQEGGRYPSLIIELLSNSTAKADKTLKKDLYQNRFSTYEYFWFSPDNLEFAGFRLVNKKYVAIIPNENGWLWSEELSLYLGIHDRQLRYFTSDGDLVPTFNEGMQQAVQRELQSFRLAQEALARADQQKAIAEQERLRAEEQASLAEQERLRAEEQASLAEQERLRAEEQASLAEQERLRADKLAQKLRELGIELE